MTVFHRKTYRISITSENIIVLICNIYIFDGIVAFVVNTEIDI